MHRFWASVIRPALDLARPATIVEIGCGSGMHTRKLLSYCSDTGTVLHGVDPLPLEQHIEHPLFRFHQGRSFDVLPLLPRPDAALVDGDHNWYTVFHELKHLERMSDGRFPLTFLHDTEWPYGRRDMYYNPSSIPLQYLQPMRKGSVVPARDTLEDIGGINAHFHHAIRERTERNGVRTAIEDFLEESREPLEFLSIPGLYGLGILFPARLRTELPALAALFDRWKGADALFPHMQAIEEQRIETLISQESMRQQSEERQAKLQTSLRALLPERLMMMSLSFKLRLLRKAFREQIDLHDILDERYRKQDASMRVLQRLHADAERRIAYLESRKKRWTSWKPRKRDGMPFARRLLSLGNDAWVALGRPFPNVIRRIRHGSLAGFLPPTPDQIPTPAPVPAPSSPIIPLEKIGKPIRFSLILPLHSVHELMVRQTLNSITEQTYGDWQVIVLSEENDSLAKRLLEEFIRKYPGRFLPFTVASFHDEPVTTARMLSLMDGTHLIPIEQHDRLERHALNLLQQRLSEIYPPDVLLYGVDTLTEDERTLDPVVPRLERYFAALYHGRFRGGAALAIPYLRSRYGNSKQPLFELAKAIQRDAPLPRLELLPEVLYHRSTTHR
jgi:hypothetical protein